MIDNELTSTVINASMKIHTALGPGLLESAYQRFLFHVLTERGLKVEQEKLLPVTFQNIKLDYGYRIDLLVENKLVVEIKTVEAFSDVHYRQVLTYLNLGNYPYGLLINFQVTSLNLGLKRLINKDFLD